MALLQNASNADGQSSTWAYLSVFKLQVGKSKKPMWKPWEVRREHVLMLVFSKLMHAHAQIIARYRTYCLVFKKRQLWGVALKQSLGSSFRKQISGLAAWRISCSEQLSITTLGNAFREQLWGEEQFCTAALNSSFEWGEALGSDFRT